MDEHVRGFYVSEQTIGRGSGCRQAFVKITERRYTSRAVVARLSYIGQESDGIGKETRVLDEKGDEVKPAGFEKSVKEWRFNPKIRDEIAARMTSPLAYPCINIEAAWRKVYNLPKMERTKELYKNKEMELKIS